MHLGYGRVSSRWELDSPASPAVPGALLIVFSVQEAPGQLWVAVVTHSAVMAWRRDLPAVVVLAQSLTPLLLIPVQYPQRRLRWRLGRGQWRLRWRLGAGALGVAAAGALAVAAGAAVAARPSSALPDPLLSRRTNSSSRLCPSAIARDTLRLGRCRFWPEPLVLVPELVPLVMVVLVMAVDGAGVDLTGDDCAESRSAGTTNCV